MATSKIAPQIIAGFAATMSLAGAGFGYGWPSPSLPKLLEDNDYLTVTPDQGSWIVSVFTFGTAIGSILGGLAADRWGRKWLLLFTIVPHVISCILIGLAQHVWLYIIARIVSGLGTGMGYAVVPMYAGEIANSRIRGAVSGLLDPVVNVAVVITYCVGPWVSLQTLAIVGGVMPLIFGVVFIWMPESPYYFIMKDKPDQAKKSLSWFRGTSDVSEELKMIQENVESQRNDTGTFKNLLMIRGNRKATIIVVGLMLAQQFSGISAVVSYSTLIFEASDTGLNANVSVIIFGVAQTLAGVATASLSDLVGRRPLMLFSTCGSILSLVGLAVYYQLQANKIDVSSIHWLPVTAMISFIVICTIGLGALPYVVFSEMFPCNVKALAMMVANITGALFSVVVTKLYQLIADKYGIHVSFWGFAGISIFSVIFIYFMLPETKHRSLQEIQDELNETTESKTALDKF